MCGNLLSTNGRTLLVVRSSGHIDQIMIPDGKMKLTRGLASRLILPPEEVLKTLAKMHKRMVVPSGCIGGFELAGDVFRKGRE